MTPLNTGGIVEEVTTLAESVLVVGSLNHGRLIGWHNQAPKQIGTRPKITHVDLNQMEGEYFLLGSKEFHSIYAPTTQITHYLADNNEKSIDRLASRTCQDSL